MAHRCDIDHLRMDGHKHRGGRVQRAHGQVTKLGRAVDHDDVVVVGDLVDGAGNAAKEQVVAAFTPLDHCARRMVFELHKLEIAWNETYPVKAGLPDNLAHRPAVFVISYGAVEGFVRPRYQTRAGTRTLLKAKLGDRGQLRGPESRQGRGIVKDTVPSSSWRSRP